MVSRLNDESQALGKRIMVDFQGDIIRNHEPGMDPEMFTMAVLNASGSLLVEALSSLPDEQFAETTGSLTGLIKARLALKPGDS